MGTPPISPAEPVPAVQAELPDWLKDLEAPAAIPEPEMTLVAPSPFKEPVAAPSEELPDWLKELKPAEPGVPAPPALTETPTLVPTASGLVVQFRVVKELQLSGAQWNWKGRACRDRRHSGGRARVAGGRHCVAALRRVRPPLYPKIPANDLAQANCCMPAYTQYGRSSGAKIKPAQTL
jgi:hypothetical protein